MNRTPLDITVVAMMTVGLLGSATSPVWNARIALYIACQSWPSTSSTFQPSLAQPATTDCGITESQVPPIWRPLRSTHARRLEQPYLTASRRASPIWPFCCSPSPMRQ